MFSFSVGMVYLICSTAAFTALETITMLAKQLLLQVFIISSLGDNGPTHCNALFACILDTAAPKHRPDCCSLEAKPQYTKITHSI